MLHIVPNKNSRDARRKFDGSVTPFSLEVQIQRDKTIRVRCATDDLGRIPRQGRNPDRAETR